MDLKPRRKAPAFYGLSFLVLAGIAAISYVQHLVPGVPLAFLYFLPLSLSGLIHRIRTSIFLVVVCLALSDWSGAPEHSGWRHGTRNLVTLTGFTAVVVFVNRLGAQRTELAAEVHAQAEELAREMRLAADVQRRLLPPRPPIVPNFEITARMYPAKAVGWDLYDFLETEKGKLGLVIADVAGKGVPAALFMPAVKIALRTNVNHADTLEEVMAKANRVIYEFTDEERFASLFYGILDTSIRRLCYVNAGHQPPLLWRDSSRKAAWLETGGPVVGLLPEVRYDSETIDLEPRDLLVLYTDGVVETHNADGEQFSRNRLVSIIESQSAATPAQLIETIYQSVVDFSETHRPQDDVTILILKAE